MKEKISFSALRDTATRVGQASDASLTLALALGTSSTQQHDEETAKHYRASPAECLLCTQPPGCRSWVREEQGAGTPLQCYRAAEAFHI